MPVLSRFIRNIPGPYLLDYFSFKAVALPADIDWEGGNRHRLRPLLEAIAALDEEVRAHVRQDAEHVVAMAVEAGQTALMTVATPEQRETLAAIESPHARALWVFLHDFPRFRHAEESASFDKARTGRTWEAFVAPIDLPVLRDEGQRLALAAELAEFFKGDGDVNVQVEVFDRDIVGEGNEGLVQVIVLREGSLVSPLVFKDKTNLEPLPHRPVGEIGFTYDPARGVIEVVAQGKEKREQLVRSFSRTLLGRDLNAERVPVRSYDLSVFMAERDFGTDPADRINSVRLQLVKFLHTDGRTNVTIEAKTPNETIHAAAERLFRDRNPFRGDYTIHEVMVSVAFESDRQNPRGRTVSVKLRHPNGCSIGETCAKERLIRRKYLPAWGVAVAPDVTA